MCKITRLETVKSMLQEMKDKEFKTEEQSLRGRIMNVDKDFENIKKY